MPKQDVAVIDLPKNDGGQQWVINYVFLENNKYLKLSLITLLFIVIFSSLIAIILLLFLFVVNPLLVPP